MDAEIIPECGHICNVARSLTAATELPGKCAFQGDFYTPIASFQTGQPELYIPGSLKFNRQSGNSSPPLTCDTIAPTHSGACAGTRNGCCGDNVTTAGPGAPSWCDYSECHEHPNTCCPDGSPALARIDGYAVCAQKPSPRQGADEGQIVCANGAVGDLSYGGCCADGTAAVPDENGVVCAGVYGPRGLPKRPATTDVVWTATPPPLLNVFGAPSRAEPYNAWAAGGIATLGLPVRPSGWAF